MLKRKSKSRTKEQVLAEREANRPFKEQAAKHFQELDRISHALIEKLSKRNGSYRP